ncbi:MAG TPA: N-acetyl-gamma-glutamyl-phosphate reductase [Ktedonobacteraceae bacterium]|nr:N-acetyl-gamma-glutamyl-phosphate reductase [Ktedonobacteraceae bacterium]
MVTVSIVNVSSYTGLELLRMLARHPEFRVTSVTGRSAAGKRLGEVFPQLQGSEPALASLVLKDEADATDLAFLCLPHAAAAEAAVNLLQRGTKVVDLSADFRLRDPAVYEEWYRHVHPAPALLETAVYGLCERYREPMERASLVANPGCHATAAILALIPALAAGIIGPDLIIDSKTGISGAGRSPTLATHFAEANEDASAYGLDGHRHLPEIIQELAAVAATSANGQTIDKQLRVTFVPHLIPMTRGILATCYADLRSPTMTNAEVRAIYEQYYEGEPFTRVVDTPPHTKWTYGSNLCLLYPTVDRRTGRLVVVSCLDNLVKGASGQAIQNANRLSGFPETMGIPAMAVFP